MKTAVILPAAGSGTRFADPSRVAKGKNKIEIDLAGRPVFMCAIEMFSQRNDVAQIILAVHPEHLETFKFRWGDKVAFHDVQLIAGGTVGRWETVQRALEVVSDECSHVAVHDAARPMTPQLLIDRVFTAAENHSAVIPGLRVSHTLKRVENAPSQNDHTDQDRRLDAILGSTEADLSIWSVIETIPRADLFEVQTPQIFERALLQRAYAALDPQAGSNITDDAQLIELIGEPVHLVEGSTLNIKLTYATDADLAAAYLQASHQKQAAELGRRRLFTDDDED